MTEKKPISPAARWRVATLALVHVLIAAHIVHWRLNGSSLSSVQLSDAARFCVEGVATAALFLFATLFLVTSVFGRFFCAWGCHMLALQEACRVLLGRFGIRPRLLQLRFLWLIPFGLALYVFGLPLLERWWIGAPFPEPQLQLTSENLWANLPGPTEGALLVLLGGVSMVYFLGSLSFCKYVCPYGAVFAIADQAALGRIRLTGECDGCAQCTAACTTGTRVHEEVQRFGMVANSGCMRCMECVHSCPRQVLAYRFGKPAFLARGRAGLTRYTFPLGEEGLMVALFAVTFFALHGLYDSFPVLVALTASTVIAFLGLVLLRLALRPAVTLRGLVLKQRGRLSRTGAVYAATAVAASLFVAHSLLIQYHHQRAETALGSLGFPRQLASYSDEQRTLARSAAAHLGFCSDHGLLDTVDWNMKQAWLHRLLDEPDMVEQHLRHAIRLNPRQPWAYFNLGKELVRQGRSSEAASAFEEAVRRAPELRQFVPATVRSDVSA